MKKHLFLPGAVFLTAFAPASPGFAHHAFSAEFDREQPIEIKGTVTKVEWMNPHARLYVEAPDPDRNGAMHNWNLELSSPNVLMRRGWGRNSLKPGDVVTVNGWRARNDPHVGNVGDVVRDDGVRMFAGSSAEQGN